LLERRLSIYTTQFALSLFRFNALWLAAFCDAKPLFLMGMSFLIYALSIHAHFFQERN